MAEPPWPPSDPSRPYDWERDDVEWGERGLTPDSHGCLMVVIGWAVLAVAIVLLYFTLLR
jgi:hypothetical protein